MDENSKEKLWDLYAKNKNPELREKIIIEYAPLVKLVAGRLSMYLGYNVEYEDLVSYGIFGLIDAIDKYDFNKNVKFETYASLRIRGAILDQIRKMDWIPRSVRQKQKKIESAMSELETEPPQMRKLPESWIFPRRSLTHGMDKRRFLILFHWRILLNRAVR